MCSEARRWSMTWTLAVLAGLAAAGWCSVPEAQSRPGTDRLRADVSLQAGPAWIAYPENHFFATRGEAAPFSRGRDLDTDDGVAGGRSIGGAVAVSLPIGQGGAWTAGVELHARWTNAHERTTRRFLDPGAGVRFGWVALDNSTGFGTPDGATLVTTVRQEIDIWTSDLLLAVEHAPGASGRWRGYLGPSLRLVDHDTDIAGRITSTVSVKEGLSTDLVGVKLGAAYRRRFASAWTGEFDLSLSRYWTDVAYRSRYVDSGGRNVRRTLTDNDTTLGFDLGAEVGREIVEGVRVSAFGSLGYLSTLPRVSYGSVPTDPAGGVLSLTTDDQMSWALGLGVNVRF